MSSLNIYVDPLTIDVQHEFNGLWDVGSTEDELLSAGAEPFPDHLRIDRKDYDDWINENDKNNSHPINYSARQTHQGSSHECVCHMLIQIGEITYNGQLGGIQYAVYGSPLAHYTRITGGRRYGGSNVMDALREGMGRGILPEHDGPAWLGGKGGQAKRFKHTIHQTSGRTEDHWPTKGWITESQFPDGWEQTARHFRILKAYTIPDANAHASALLRRWAVGNGRQGHSIPHVQWVKNSNGVYLSKYRDSYLRDLYDSERLLGGGFCVAAMTAPDNPQLPAGADMLTLAL